MINSTNDLADKLWKAANFYDEFGLSPKTASLLYDASNIARSVNRIVDKNDKLKDENARLLNDNAHLQEIVTDDELRVRKVLDENTHLRELVAKYSAAAKYLCGFSHCNECNLSCASVFDGVPNGWDCARMLLDKEMRELGIEGN